MSDFTEAEGADETPGSSRGGTWLTYRYRLGGGAAEAAGTIKAPSFMSAARRLLADRLADRVGSEPAYLRLRAAGEREVLLRVARGPDGTRGELQLELVPPGTFQFPESLPSDAPDL